MWPRHTNRVDDGARKKIVHCSNAERERLTDWLDTPDDGTPPPTPGKLSYCTDTLPWEYCSQLDIPQGSTYAQGIRVAYRLAVMADANQ